MPSIQAPPRGKRRHPVEPDESEEDHDQTLDEGPSTSGLNNLISRIDNRELLQDVLQFIMVGASSKGFVREADLRKVFGTNSTKEARDATLNKVREKFDAIFGLKLYHDEVGQRYYLGSELQIPSVSVTSIRLDGSVVDTSNEDFKDGLLVSALMFIFMAKRHVIEDEPGIKMELLREFLKKVSDTPNDVFSAFFGPSKTAEFLGHGWLNCTVKRDPGGEETTLYDWGPRADTVVSKRKLLESFCELYGTQITDWLRHAAKAGLRVTI